MESKLKINSLGIVHPYILITLVIIGIIIYLIISSTLPFKDKLFNLLYPKPSSQAQEVYKNNSPEFLSNEILIKIKKPSRGRLKEANPHETGLSSLDSINREFQVKSFERVVKIGKNSDINAEVFAWYKLKLDGLSEIMAGKLNQTEGIVESHQRQDDPVVQNPQALLNLQKIIARLKIDPNIEKVDLNYIVHTTAVPNDPYYSSSGSWGQTYQDLYGMYKINAASAWDQTTGSQSIIVADIDTGVDRNHEDIATNMWVNSAETPGNGIDDDSNGYIDDYYGCNFINMVNNVCGDPMDDHGHGTHTVGTIAGVGNNGLGVVGVNWISKIMALKFLSSAGSGSLDDGAKALVYAADMGARISSNSWGGGVYTQLLDDALKYEHDTKGMVPVFAAGNSNADALDFSPAMSDYVITVAASDYNDAKASFSNWGEKIDVAAPGVDILSARAANNPMCTASRTVGTNYCRVSGTSMATPHVAGLAALLLSKNPNLSNEEIRQIIRSGANDLGTPGKDRDFGFGRINALGSMNIISNSLLSPFITLPRSRTVISGQADVSGQIAGSSFASYRLEVGSGTTPASWSTVNASTTQPSTNGSLGTFNTTTLPDGGNYTFRLTATDTGQKTYQSQVFDISIDNIEALITSPSGIISGQSVDIFGTAQIKGGIPFGSYSLEYSTDGVSWSSSGISLVNGGTNPVLNGKLATWDLGSVNDNNYTLRLKVITNDGRFDQKTAALVIDNIDAIITSPVVSVASRGGIQVIGTAQVKSGLVFDSYILEWGLGQQPTSWSTAGITLTNGGTQALVDGVLGTWNTSSLGDALYTLRLTVKSQDGRLGFGTSTVASDKDILPGWPKDLGGYVYGGLAVGDLDNNGQEEVIVADPAVRKIYAYKKDGTTLAGWPVSSSMFGNDPIAIEDINGDGSKEVITNQVNVIGSDGTSLAGWPQAVAGSFATPAVADLDGNGSKEIVTLSHDFSTSTLKVYALNNNGSTVAGFPKTVFSNGVHMQSSFENYNFSLVDLDKDGKVEMLINPEEDNVDKVYVLDYQGNIKSGWPQTITGKKIRRVLGGDITGDGLAEVVVYYASQITGGATDVELTVFDRSGNQLPNYPQGAAGGVARMGPALADATGDGALDIVIPVYGRGTGDTTYDCSPIVFDKNGLVPNPSCYKGHETLPVIVDFDGDGQPEVIASSPGQSAINVGKKFYDTSGQLGWQTIWEKKPGQILTQPVVSDIDHNGKWEIITMVNAVNSTQVFVWEPTSSNASQGTSWNQYLKDAARTSTYPVGILVPTPTFNPTPTPTPSSVPTILPTPTPTPLPPPPSPTTIPTNLGNIVGIVTSNINNLPIQGVKVVYTVNGARQTTLTDSQGRYYIFNIPAKSYTLKFSHPQYRNQEASVVVTAGQTVTKNITLFKK